MIRRFPVTSAAILFLALAAPFTAQAQNIFAMAGGVFPTSESADAFDTGWMVAGGITFPLGPGGFWLGVEGSYGQNGTAVDGVDANPIGAMAILGFDLPVPGGLSPYVFAGAGLLAVRDFDIDLTDTESKFGYQLGGGLNLGSGIISPFIEVRYAASDEIDFFAANLGLSIGVGK
jgi:opacity protein-like surface antigen